VTAPCGGREGTGLLRQTGGDIATDAVYVGLQPGADGAYDLTGGMLSADLQHIGAGGSGRFAQQGGANKVGTLLLHRSHDVSYELQAGLLIAGDIHVGEQSFGGDGRPIVASFAQTGGVLQADRMVVAGFGLSTDMSTLTFAGGRADCDSIDVGFNTQLHLTGGQLAVSDTLTIAQGATLIWRTDDLSAGNLVFGADQGNGTAPRVAMGFDFDVDDLADGTLTGGTVIGLENVKLCVANGAVATHDDSAVALALLTTGDAGGRGEYHLAGDGSLAAKTVLVGVTGPGGIVIDSPDAALTVTNQLVFSQGGTFAAADSSRITVDTGDVVFQAGAHDADLAGLNSLALTFSGGDALDAGTLEVAGLDVGDDEVGLVENFALAGLIVGAGQAAYLQLINTVDNQAGLAEALYVGRLIIGDGATLDLNGQTLYYSVLDLSPTAALADSQMGFRYFQIDAGSGDTAPVPEPTVAGMLLLTAGALLRRRRTRS
jgi:hypothetical protein